MPSLKDLNCSIELSDDQEPLQEFGTVYGDAFVETFIPVPKKQRTFTVHLSSRDFIAPGIAMYVFIDGVYQCNRNRQNMKLRKPPDRRSLVDFKVRQKEEKLKDGSMVAREWTFEKLDHASADVAPHSCSPNILENIGCIEVVVLRCAGPRNAKTAANMNLDGANDYPDYRFDRDSRSRTTAYDDRNPFLSAASKHGPPPRITSYRSPCAETVRSRELPKRAYSRYSESVSPGTHPQRDIPAPAFQYGSGPLPSHSNAGTHRGFLDEAKGSGVLRTASTVDPSMLEKIVADAVKRGVEESMKNDVSNGRRTVSREDQRDVDSSSQVPGAWPTSPTHRSKHHQHRLAPSKRHDRDDHREDRDLVWEHRPTRSRAETRVAWDEELEWDKQSRGDGWCSPEDNLTDSWDIEETWSEKQPHDWEGVRHRSRSCGRVTRSPSRSRRVSYISSRTADRQRSRHGRSHRPRSRSHSQWVNDSKSSSDDTDGWICIEAPSDSSNSLERSDSTLKPSHSRSQVQPSRNKSGRRSSRRQSSQTRHGHRLSQLVGNPQWHPESVYYARPPSVLVTNASTMMSAPISQYQADVRSRKQSIYTWPTASVVAPPPTWGCASEKVRRNSAAMTCLPPAPFSTTGVEHHESRNYSGSSSWGVTQDTSKNKEVKKSSLQQSIWGEDKKSDKTQRAWGEADNKSTDWSPDQEQEWGDDSAAEINGGGWNSTEKDNNGWDTSKDTKEVVVDGWNTDNSNDTWRQDDVKDAEAGSWNAENNDQGWGLNDTSKDEQNPTGGGFEEGDANNNGWNTEQDNDTSWNQPQDTTNDAPFNPDTGWIAAPVVEEKAERKAKSPSTSKRHTSKSLSKYRQLSAPSTEAKPHWQFPPPPSKKTLRSLIEDQASEQSDTTRRIPSAPSEPLYKIPRSVAEEKGVRHQVLAGPGTRYGHAISRPEYIDRLDKPYAVFRFKYRSRSMLRSMFGNDCLSKTGTTMVPAQKEDLEALPQSELIRKMLALQCRLEEEEGEKGGDGETGSQCTESVAMDRAEKWVTQHSREASERGKKKKAESEKSRAKSAEKVAGWDDGEAMKWNGKEVRW